MHENSKPSTQEKGRKGKKTTKACGGWGRIVGEGSIKNRREFANDWREIRRKLGDWDGLK